MKKIYKNIFAIFTTNLIFAQQKCEYSESENLSKKENNDSKCFNVSL